jgi:hypothetical protein
VIMATGFGADTMSHLVSGLTTDGVMLTLGADHNPIKVLTDRPHESQKGRG